jgi:arylsulfatase A-like enzyme
MGKGPTVVAIRLLRRAFCAAVLLAGAAPQPAQAAASSKPNIIFVILDDVGIDQLALFGNGGVDPPKVPNLELIAARGVKFTNVWATPECSPSRATVFTGRFALHTGVEDIIADNHLPQSYVSSFEATLPRVLAKAGYTSAMMGKYHLGNTQDPRLHGFPGRPRRRTEVDRRHRRRYRSEGQAVLRLFPDQGSGCLLQHVERSDKMLPRRCQQCRSGHGPGAHLPAAWRHFRAEQSLRGRRPDLVRFQPL